MLVMQIACGVFLGGGALRVLTALNDIRFNDSAAMFFVPLLVCLSVVVWVSGAGPLAVQFVQTARGM